jgi:hypothetical protein
MYEDPPSGQNWFFTNIEEIFADPVQVVNGNMIYANPDDIVTNNWLDYLIFYAHSNIGVGLVDTVRCIENSSELTWYKQSYVSLTQDWVANSNNKKFYQCNYMGFD